MHELLAVLGELLSARVGSRGLDDVYGFRKRDREGLVLTFRGSQYLLRVRPRRPGESLTVFSVSPEGAD